MRNALLLLAAVLCSVSALAQSGFSPVGGDERIRRVQFAPNRVVDVIATPGYQLTINLDRSERGGCDENHNGGDGLFDRFNDQP